MVRIQFIDHVFPTEPSVLQKGCLANNKEAKLTFGPRLTIFFAIADAKLINGTGSIKFSHFLFFPRKQLEKKGNNWK